MSDIDHDAEFDQAFEAALQVEEPKAPPAEPPKADDTTPPATPPAPQVEEPKKDEQPPAEPKKEEGAAPTGDAPKTEEGAQPPKAPETPPAPQPSEEEPKPLTKDDVTSIIRDLQNSERNSGRELETTTQEVLNAYYPEGLSNTLVDQNSGKELRTPQDVVDASNGEMSIEQATQWLMNEQYKMDREVAGIKQQAEKIAETTLNFTRDSMAALHKYEPLFKAYPKLQTKAYDLLMKQTKVDQEKGVVLSAPDVMDLYDTYLEPYQLAFEHQTQQPATNSTTPPAPAPPQPGAEDRLDEGGDGGQSPVDDPNDFAQQVSKELAKGI